MLGSFRDGVSMSPHFQLSWRGLETDSITNGATFVQRRPGRDTGPQDWVDEKLACLQRKRDAM